MKKNLLFLIFFSVILGIPHVANAQYGTLAPVNTTAAPTLTSQPIDTSGNSYTAPTAGVNSATGGANLNGASPTVTSYPMNQFQTTGGETTAPATPAATAPANTGTNLPYQALEPIPGLTTNPDLTNPGNLPTIVNAIFTILISVGALLAVLMLTVGGIEYMVSSTIKTKQEGLKRAQAALWGIVLIAASWLILNTINPKLLSFNLNPCTQDMQQQGLCTVTANSNTSNNNSNNPAQATAPPCGDFPEGCGTAQYCGNITNAGIWTTTCLRNSDEAAAQACSNLGQGAVWTQGSSIGSGSGAYCYLPAYTTPESCTNATDATGANAGYKWAPWIWQQYCYKQ
ncbi:MAG: pilin [Minisyncoccia bacterium]|jgi:hypothetical protein